jgi:CubicO group peptidase (beta-lactamase class C family)
MKKAVILSLLILYFFNVPAQTISKNLKSIVHQYSSDSILNASVIIAQKDNILFQGSFGYKNIETKEMISPSTRFPIASLTKQFTSTAILLLQENNKLSINDKIGDYIEVPESMKDISIKNLMNHTSGIPDYWQNNIYNQKDSIYHFLNQKDTLQFTLNSKQRYCNSGYFLLGEIIESVSGNSYGDFLSENIFKPLGMKNTCVYDGKEIDRAIGYDEEWNKNDYLMTTGDGGIISTVEDLYLWDKALFENKILSSASRDKMFSPLKLNNGTTTNYGYGWDINENNSNIVSHTGWLASFGAYNQFDKETAYYIILLSNQIRPELMDLINKVNGELYKAKTDKK